MARHFTCSGFFSVTGSFRGLLYPFYTRAGFNIPYVQEIDRHGAISAFIEFPDLEHYPTKNSAHHAELQIGDSALFAYYDDLQLIEASHATLKSHFRTDDFDHLTLHLPSLTRLGLARLVGVAASRHAELLSGYLGDCRLPEGKIDQIMKADRRIYASQESWWAEIFKSEFGESESARDLVDSNYEEMIYWLFENEVDEDWKKICAGLLKKVLFDERIADILSKFISVMDDFADYDFVSKIIVGRGMDLYAQDPKFGGDFVDIMFEKVVDGSIFYLGTVLPPNVVENFLKALIFDRSEGADADAIIDSMLDYFDSDVILPRIVPAIINVFFESDLSVTYPERSYYAGITRFDRFVDIFRFNPAIRLSLTDESLVETMNEIVSEVEKAEEELDDQTGQSTVGARSTI